MVMLSQTEEELQESRGNRATSLKTDWPRNENSGAQ